MASTLLGKIGALLERVQQQKDVFDTPVDRLRFGPVGSGGDPRSKRCVWWGRVRYAVRCMLHKCTLYALAQV